ncbi:MAG: Fe-S oxidoreductase [Microbacteriaceae bacterium]|nr:Fe-S oxidoreductase [Microbacteriaceae bacterium]
MPSRFERATRALVRATKRIPGLRRVLLWPAVARPGYWVATACGVVWGGILSRGHLRRSRGVIVASGCPRWAFGRGGTTIGAVYLTSDNHSSRVLDHEAVHRAQWKHYGLAFVPLYFAAGAIATENRFEIAAGLDDGGYE